MAQTSYTTQQAVTLATRAEAYRRIGDFLQHLDPLNLNLLSMVLNGNNTISFTLNNPLPQAQADHLGLVEG